jgi:hypothetical protein
LPDLAVILFFSRRSDPTDPVRVEACGDVFDQRCAGHVQSFLLEKLATTYVVGGLRRRLIGLAAFLFGIAETEPSKNLIPRVSMQFESLCRQSNIAPTESDKHQDRTGLPQEVGCAVRVLMVPR